MRSTVPAVPKSSRTIRNPGSPVPLRDGGTGNRLSLAGHFPINALFPWVTMAGSALHCARCRAEGRAPLPRDVAAYNRVVEGFVAEHKTCQEGA